MNEQAINEAPPKRTGLRTFGAGLTGILVVVAFSVGTDALMRALGVFPPSGKLLSGAQFLLAVAYRTVYSIAGSYIAARLAPVRPMRLALILGWIGVLVNILGVVAAWNHTDILGPRWYPIMLTVLALPCAWLGGMLAVAGKNRPSFA